MENIITSEDINTDKLMIESLQQIYITDMHNMQIELEKKDAEIRQLKYEILEMTANAYKSE